MDEQLWPLLVLSTTLAFGVAVAFSFKNLFVKILAWIANKLARLLTTSIEIQCNEGMTSNNVTTWLKQLIERNSGVKLGHFRITNDIYKYKCRDPRLMAIIYNRYGICKEEEGDESEEDEDDKCEIRKQVEPLQTDQSAFFFYKRTCIQVTRKVNRVQKKNIVTETFKITAYGTRNKQLLIDMLEDGRKMTDMKPSAHHVNYYKARHQMGHSQWALSRRIQPRPLSSIILKEGVTSAIQKDLAEFIESKEWYKERGIPYRRGYLLYGPPGCGKTSFVKAISGLVGYDIHELQLSNAGVNDESLNQLMSTISSKAILLFEDIDCVFKPRIQDEERSSTNDGLLGKLKIRESNGSLSFSGLLNAIDGVASEEDYIIFMTTNHIEKLDSALIRPGRVDMRQLIDYPDEQQIVEFFRKFYPECDDDVSEKFAKAVVNVKCSPTVAQIQGIFLRHKHEPEDNLLDVDTLIEICKSNADLALRNIYL